LICAARGIWSDSSCISVRMFHVPGTDANASQIELASEDYIRITGVIKDTSISDHHKLINFEDVGEPPKILDSDSKKIVLAIAEVKNRCDRGPIGLINFNDLVSPENFRSV
jgi:hypothetical protein